MKTGNGKGSIWVVTDPAYGDNGKGRIVDFLTAKEEVAAVVRWQGGANAGHEIVVGDVSIDVHCLPSGFVRAKDRQILNVMGRGMVVSLPVLFAEIDKLRQLGIPITPKNLLISNGLHLTLPYHLALEQARESGSEKKGTTKRAISQTYGFGRMYMGIRMGNLKKIDEVRKLIQEPLAYANAILEKVYAADTVSEEVVMTEIEEYREAVIPFLGDEVVALNHLVREKNETVLCEGAQSGLLGIDLGIYPYSTASNTWPGSIQQGCGLDPRLISRNILVIKSYLTRVGPSPMPTEMNSATAELIRERGHEYGVTTKRPRRIGWPDSMIGHYCAMVGPGTELAINKSDVLTGIPDLYLGTGYRKNGTTIDSIPTIISELEGAKPILKKFPGWKQDITGVTSWDDLPEQLQNFLREIAKPYGCPISYVGTGAERSQIIDLV